MAAAAIGGAKRGTDKGKQLARENRLRESNIRAELAAAQKRMVDGILATYDEEQNGTLNKAEVTQMLKDYSSQAYGAELQPTENDIQFLFSLYDKSIQVPAEEDKGTLDPQAASTGTLDRNEIEKVCGAWGDFLKKKDLVAQLHKTYDASNSGNIDVQELQDILDATKDELENPVADVPSEVTQWIFQQADVTRNGLLSELELARALCAFELWSGKRGDFSCPNPLWQDIRGRDSVPKPVPATSQCCTVC